MPIERVTEFKFLGVLIDSNLTWSLHCNYIANILSRMCGVVSSLTLCTNTYLNNNIQLSVLIPHKLWNYILGFQYVYTY